MCPPLHSDRYQELANEFELADLDGQGALSEQRILDYLSEKYDWVNAQILGNLFRRMEWFGRDNGTDREFAVRK